MAEGTPTAEQKRTRREQGRAALLVLLAVLITLFAVLNVKDVEVNWIFGKSSTPLIVVILVSLLVGILLGHFAGIRSRRRQD
ncbi:MAG: lipopolysaccharide assembly protein LapA domain-containing protein [Solirubrobacteraceae bacterium]